MKKVLVVSSIVLVLVVAIILHGQSVGNGTFSGTIGTTPLSGSFTLSVVDQCSGASNAKSSAVITGAGGASEIVAGVSGKSIYVCGFALGTFGGSNKFSYGTTTQCLSQAGTLLTGNLLSSTTPAVVVGNSNQTVLAVPSGNSLCNDNGSQGFVTFVQK